MFKYFDVHSHLNLSQFDLDREDQINKLQDLEIGTIVVGTNKTKSEYAVELAGKNLNIWATIGQHPTDIDEEFDFNFFEKLAQNPRVVGVGECGLDYYREGFDKERQKEIFIQQIELALKYDKALMIHSRPSKGSMNAYEEVLDILENYKERGVRANFHFFVGDVEIAKRALGLGFTMSFDGPITFSRDYDEVIKFIPLESILAETDAPFAAPIPYRGQRCEPYHVIEIVKKIAEIKGEDLEKVRDQLVKNSFRVFGIK